MITHIRAATLLWCAIAVSLPLSAQQKENTLGLLWLQVKENDPGIRSKTFSVDAAKLNEKAVKSHMLPQVKAQAQNSYGTYEGSAGAFFPQSGIFNVNGSPSDNRGSSTAANSFGSSTVEWDVYSFGKLRKQHEAAGVLVEKSLSDKAAYILELKKTLSERYITLLYTHSKEEWTKKNAARLDDIRKITAVLSASGLRPAADSLLASSSYMQALGEFDKWSGFKRASLVKLAELYGPDSIKYGASILRFNSTSAAELQNPPSLPSSHPILQSLHQQSAYLTLAGQAQKSDGLPSIKLLGGYAFRGTGIHQKSIVSGSWADGFSNSTHNVLIGIGITWNVTGWYSNRMKSAQFSKQAESTQMLRTQYEQALQADLSASKVKIRQQSQQLLKTALAVKQTQEAYEMYLARYKSGLIGLSELLQIRWLLEQAEQTHLDASRDYWMLLAYEAALTTDFEFLFNNL